jgi:hypothetical protein
MSTTTSKHDTAKGPTYEFQVDGNDFAIDSETITGGEIMDLAGIPRDAGLVQILDDGTQRQVPADEVIELKPGHRFKKRPRFQRG